MNLVDSSGWLEYLSDSKNAKKFAEAIENTEELLVSSINIYEIYKKILKEKDENTALQIIGLMRQAKVVDVTSSIAVQAAKLSYEKNIPMADSIIYTTAIVNEAIVWTQDIDFKGLDSVKYFAKK
ncbi:MAG: type II toxin-antitoxin system VapC family toxin [Melioribacteraceae bacterium]|nr:type II toxin-antitoxin system VapC family toxin [Melioribacteraceae bacterium]MCF8356913.1 type II toxin-antitoxin system VapC family toxin [Melioribacteraceae bacterium]MCF8418156.1 type II toxin-antitoxin system VapC family toxin [Melioribacteraceae bacterium]